MLGYVMKGSKRTPSRADAGCEIPDDLCRRLEPWLDVREVGADGLWLWLGTVLSVLPLPAAEGVPAAPAGDRTRELARDLVDCARERARLHVLAERYYRDNRLLAQRLRALEAALRTLERTGRSAEVAPDPDGAGDAANRYLPR